MSGGDLVTLTMPAKPEYVALCRLALAGLGQRCGLDLETVADLKVAISEACSWSIRHSQQAPEASDPSAIRVDIGVEPERWVITVGHQSGAVSDGRGLDAGPNSEDVLGLTVIRALVDDVQQVQLDPARTALVMTKRLV